MKSECNNMHGERIKIGNEPSGSIKCGEFLDYLRTGWLRKKNFATWSKK